MNACRSAGCAKAGVRRWPWSPAGRVWPPRAGLPMPGTARAWESTAGFALGAHWQAVGHRTDADERLSCRPAKQRHPPCRLNRPSPKLRREAALRRAISALVPLAQYQAPRAKFRGTCASARSAPARRMVGGSPTGAAVGTGIQHSLGRSGVFSHHVGDGDATYRGSAGRRRSGCAAVCILAVPALSSSRRPGGLEPDRSVGQPSAPRRP